MAWNCVKEKDTNQFLPIRIIEILIGRENLIFEYGVKHVRASSNIKINEVLS